jgi:hypothetical protein
VYRIYSQKTENHWNLNCTPIVRQKLIIGGAVFYVKTHT